MRVRLGVVAVTIVAVLALAAPSFGAYSEPVVEKATLVVVKNGRKPTWKLRYLLCYQGTDVLQAQIAEYSYAQGAKFRTLQVQTRGERRLPDPSDLGGTGTCAWYTSMTYKSKFPQRAGYSTGVTLQVFAEGTPDHVTTRSFRLHP
jgi:hypothetical protein